MKPASREVVARNLKEARARTGKTQAEVAKELDVSQATVCGWEQGTFEPQREVWGELEKVLGTPAVELFFEPTKKRAAR